MAEFTPEKMRDQRLIGRELAPFGWERPTRSICLVAADLRVIFDACGTETTPEVKKALEWSKTNMIVNGRMFRGVTKPEVLQREALFLAGMLHAVITMAPEQ